MAFECKKGHVHGTQQEAEACYICKRRAAKKSRKIFKREQQVELSEVLNRTLSAHGETK